MMTIRRHKGDGCMTNGDAVILWQKRKTKKTGNGERERCDCTRQKGRREEGENSPSSLGKSHIEAVV
jgi:hypothetical protein